MQHIDSISSPDPIPTHQWSVAFYRVSSWATQQRILSAFRRIGHVNALGTHRDDEWWIVVDSPNVGAEATTWQLLLSIDPEAAQAHVSRSQRAGPIAIHAS